MSEPERRRRRPTVSCSLCKRRKIRCDRKNPCSNCTRSRNGTCVYENQPPLPPRQRNAHGLGNESGLAQNAHEPIPISRASSIHSGSTLPSLQSNSLIQDLTNSSSYTDLDSIGGKLGHSEEQSSNAQSKPNHTSTITSTSNIETTLSSLGEAVHVLRESRPLGPAQRIARSTTHKTRFFGQSFWINGIAALFQEIYTMIEPYVRDKAPKAFAGIQQCKHLARVIKSQRTPPWPSLPMTDLPPKDVADELLNCYLRTTESIYRILHVPTFKKDYEAIWESNTEPNMAFLVQLKLVLAIGATTYDEQFSLRTSAMRWVCEAHTWMAEPKFKSRIGIQSLQTNILLLIARETADFGGDTIWISVGELFRRAVYMGLHRDPAHLPRTTILAAEMRRRLWNTVLELTLQSSLTSGGPPLLSLADFDTEPPSNYNDDQLVTDNPVPKPDGEFTQLTIAIALRRSFPIRLAVTKFLNDLNTQGTYEETLRLDTELRASYKVLRQTLQKCSSSTGPSPSHFDLGVVDFLMRRYISALHVPFFVPALYETAYAFSRKVVVETSIKIWCAAYPTSSIMNSHPRTDLNISDRNDLARLTTLGSGTYRTTAMQAIMLVAMEVKRQLQEEEGLDPVFLRPDLLAMLKEAQTWCMECLEAGETNMKGCLLVALTVAHIEGLMRGVERDEMAAILVKAGEEAQAQCLPVLEKMAAQGQAEGTLTGLDQITFETPTDPMGDWDFMLSDDLFSPGTTDSMGWMFNDDTMQGLSQW